MSINAKVSGVYFGENGVHRMELEPWNDGEQREPPGQSVLMFCDSDKYPPDVNLLAGHHVWGSANSLMHGQTKIANRLGYTHIRFVVKSIGQVIYLEEQRKKVQL